jgi:allantoin racemase
MKIKVIIPVSTDKWTTSVKADYAQYKQPDIAIEIVHLLQGPEAIQSEYDEAKAAAHVLEEVSKTPPGHYDAIIIYCFSDPGLSGAREISTIPVLGIGESSQLFTIKRFLSILPLGIPVLEYDQKEKVARRALEVARYMVEQEGIEALILGCGSLLGVKEQIQAAFAIPVVEPGLVTLKHAEMLISLGLSQSKKSYMTPLPIKEH